jgi:L-lactate dehydrogenase
MKTGIVGCGLVGATAAYALVMRGVGGEVVLVDKNAQRARAEADDILHAVPFASPLEVRAGDYADLAGCAAVIVAAGVAQRPGETRLDLLNRNADVFRDVIPQLVRHAPGAVLVIATNPVDVMTHLAAQIVADAGGNAARVLGSGTTLDTARFRALLGGYCGVDPQHVHGYVIGEHGDSEVLTWSSATIGGMALADFVRWRGLEFSDAVRQSIDEKVRRAAYTIIGAKGATYYGIGSALARLCDAILHDQRALLTVCCPASEIEGVTDVTVSLPRLVGGSGVLATLPFPLTNDERQALKGSAHVVREAIDSLRLRREDRK